MAANGHGRSRTTCIWALRILLGLVFLAVGTTKLTGTGNTVEYFTAIAWGQWFRYLLQVSPISPEQRYFSFRGGPSTEPSCSPAARPWER